MSWAEPLKRSDVVDPGKVYYINVIMFFPRHKDWTMAQPFTLNPDGKKDFERVLKTSNEIPVRAKAGLLKNRVADLELSGGKSIRFIVSDEPAPHSWGHLELKQGMIIY